MAITGCSLLDEPAGNVWNHQAVQEELLLVVEDAERMAPNVVPNEGRRQRPSLRSISSASTTQNVELDDRMI